MINLYKGDCLELMRDIPDKSINLILTDPPYNIGIADWDKIENYVEWFGNILKECERVLKDNGTIYFFHNDMVQIAQIMEWIRKNTNFKYNSFIIWDKGNFRSLSWKNPSNENKLRCWFNTCEYCLVYTFQDDRGYHDMTMFKDIRDYFKMEREKISHLSYKQINERLGFKTNGGGYASDVLNSYKLNWKFPLKHIYEKFQTLGICLREYEDLRREYEAERYVHNLDVNHNNLWTSKKPRNNGALHPTQKPLDILERMIKTSSNINDVILDPFMGSGSTGVACVNTGRSFIGIELDEHYYNIAEERINNVTQVVR